MPASEKADRGEWSVDLVVHALFQSMLVRPEATVGGSQLLLQPLWGELIQPHCKLGHVVPGQPRQFSLGFTSSQQPHADNFAFLGTQVPGQGGFDDKRDIGPLC